MLGARAEGYDPTRQAISRLAAFGASSRPAMTAGLVILGAGMILYGLAVQPDRVWPWPVANGLTTLAVAAIPLGGGHDTVHGIAAGVGYVTLAAIPLAHRDHRSRLAGAVCGLSLLASVLVSRGGLLQRLGLTAGQLWVVVSALRLLRSPTSSSTTPRARGPEARRR